MTAPLRVVQRPIEGVAMRWLPDDESEVAQMILWLNERSVPYFVEDRVLRVEVDEAMSPCPSGPYTVPAFPGDWVVLCSRPSGTGFQVHSPTDEVFATLFTEVGA